MLALILLGAVVTALAFFRGWFSWTSDDSWPVWQSIFTNFGVGILSAAALLLCEPLLRKVVTDTVSHAAAGVRDELRGEVESQIDDRLAPLSERIDSLYETRLANQSKALDNLAQDFTYERVKRAFEEAARVGALFGNKLEVQADEEPGKLRIGLRWGPPYTSGMSHDRQIRRTAGDSQMHLTGTPGNPQLSVAIVWEPGEEFYDAVERLTDRLTQNRGRPLGERIDWTTIRVRFEKGIQAAVAASNKSPGRHQFEGMLIETIGPDDSPWYLTTEGIYRPTHDWHLSRTAVTGLTDGSRRIRAGDQVDNPAWAASDEWAYIVNAARRHFSRPAAANVFDSSYVGRSSNF
ncbi:hypothetical protein HP499_02180 [Paenarthrobacter sp. CM16]|nr:hypothetical protein [Paenarthrobacter sp. CM16]